MFDRIRRSRFAQDVLPLVTSLAVHLAIVLAGVATLRMLTSPAPHATAEAQAVSPEMQVMAAELPDRTPLADFGLGERPEEAAGFSRDEALRVSPPEGVSLTEAGAPMPDTPADT